MRIALSTTATLSVSQIISMDLEGFMDALDAAFNVPVAVDEIDYVPVSLDENGNITFSITGTVDEEALAY